MSFKRNIKLFGLFNFFDSFDFLVPIKIVYFYQIVSSYSVSASIIAFVWIFSSILEVPTGVFSDFIGRKKTMLLGSLCVLLGYVLYATGINYWFLFAGAILEGASRAFFSGNNDAYLHESLNKLNIKEEFDSYYGKINSLLTVSAFTASLLSGFLASISFKFLIWINIIPQFISFILIFFMKDAAPYKGESANIYSHLKEAITDVKQNLNLRYLSLATIFSGAGQAAYDFQVAVFAAVWPTWAIGIARALQEVSGIPGYYFANRIIKRLGAVNIIMYQTAVSWIGNILGALLASVISPLVISASIVFYGPSDTATQSLLQKEFTDRQRATIASLNSLGRGIYFAIVFYISGLVADFLGPFVGLITTQIFFLPVVYYRWNLFKRINKETSPRK